MRLEKSRDGCPKIVNIGTSRCVSRPSPLSPMLVHFSVTVLTHSVCRPAERTHSTHERRRDSLSRGERPGTQPATHERIGTVPESHESAASAAAPRRLVVYVRGHPRTRTPSFVLGPLTSSLSSHSHHGLRFRLALRSAVSRTLRHSRRDPLGLPPSRASRSSPHFPPNTRH